MTRAIVVLFVVLFLAGCQSVPKKNQTSTESSQEIITAIGTMTEGLTNSPVTQEQLKNVAKDMDKDPQVKSAVQSVNSAFELKVSDVKYCPVCGKRYSSRVEKCSVDQTILLPVE